MTYRRVSGSLWLGCSFCLAAGCPSVPDQPVGELDCAAITACINDDACCPPGCEELDSDCAVSPTVFSPVPVFGDRLSYDELHPSRWEIRDDGGDRRYFLATTDFVGESEGLLGEYTVARDATFADVSVVATARSAEDLTANHAADLCLVLGFVDAANYYYAMFSSHSDYSAIFKVEAGVRVELASAGVAAFADSDYHVFEFVRVGTNLQMVVDGVVLAHTNDSTFGAGGVGIGSYNDSAFFDDVDFRETAGPDCGDDLCEPPGETCSDCPADCGPCPTATPAFRVDFEDGTLEPDQVGYGINTVGVPSDAIRVVDNPEKDTVNASNKVMFVSTVPSTTYTRAEYHTDWGSPFPTNGKRHTFQWMVYFPQDHLDGVNVHNHWHVITQFVTNPCARYPPDKWLPEYDKFSDGRICYSGGIFNDAILNPDDHNQFEFEFRAHPDCAKVPFVYPRAQWVKLTYDIFWTTESDGYYSVWVNETLIGQATSVQTLPAEFVDGTCDIRWKVGLYDSWSSDSGVELVYYYIDDMNLYIDQDFAAVCPGCE